jgi:hypothetical protein
MNVSRFLVCFVFLAVFFCFVNATHPPSGSMPDELEQARQQIAKAKDEILRAEALLNQNQPQAQGEVKGIFSKIGTLFGRHEKEIPTDAHGLKEQVKDVLTGEPSTTEQIKERFREFLHFGQDKAGETAEDMKRKSEEAKGAFQHGVDYVKHQAEELKEGLKANVHRAQEAAGDVKSNIEGKLYEGKEYVKDKAEQAAQTIGLQEKPKGLFERAKEKVVHLFHPTPTGTLEETTQQLKQKFQDMTGFHGHDVSALEEMKKRYEEARDELLRKTQEMYDYMAHDIKEPAPTGFQKAKNEVMARFNEWQSAWDKMKHSVGNRMSRVMGTGANYLIQSSRYENGLSMQYINDNGLESLAITGENVDPKLDTLRALNHFRQEFNLPTASGLSNVTVDVHQLHRPNVTIKSTRVEADVTYEYGYHDGKETLNVTFVGSHRPTGAVEDQKILNTFRKYHGISVPEKQDIQERYHHSHHPQAEL